MDLRRITKGLAPSSLLASLSFAVGAHAAPALKLRGTILKMPFELRVLVNEVPRGQSLEISGYALHDEQGKKIPNESITCRLRRDGNFFLASLNPLIGGGAKESSWSCTSDGYERIVSGPTRFEVSLGFLSANGRSYRQALELIPKDDRLLVVNAVGVEEYLAGLVNREIKSSYPAEAVKAQVIAARSYALATAADRRAHGWLFDVYGNEKDQMYQGAQDEDGRAHRLVRETAGLVLMLQEDILKAYYHASNGGFSELPQYVWSEKDSERDALAFLAQPSPSDERLKSTRWSIVLSPSLGYQWPGIGRLTDIKVLSRSPGQRIQSIKVIGSDGEETMTGYDFRRKLGANWVRSTYFTIRPIERGWVLEGRGHGHGVGLSQLGARALAHEGYNSDEILGQYYPFSSLRKIDLDGRVHPVAIGTR